MALHAPQTKDINFTPAPAGTHLARCIGIYDLGKQKKVYLEEVSWKPQLRLTFELPNCLMTEGELAGKPFIVSNNYTLSLHKNALLRRDIEGWANKKLSEENCSTLDILAFLGKPCTLNIVHNEGNGRTYANIASISPKMEGMDCPEAANPLISFEIANHTPEEWAALPEWLQNKINLLGAPDEAAPTASPAPTDTADEYFKQTTEVPNISDEDIPNEDIPF